MKFLLGAVLLVAMAGCGKAPYLCTDGSGKEIYAIVRTETRSVIGLNDIQYSLIATDKTVCEIPIHLAWKLAIGDKVSCEWRKP